VFAFLFLASSALAHHAVEQPSLGRLILDQEIVVRGAVVGESRLREGALVARLRVEKVLKGRLAEKEIEFASDPDHGVRYRAGERALVFASRAHGKPALVSPQVFSMKYPITSFDPSGYDALVAGLLAAERLDHPAARLHKLKEVLIAQLASHEKAVRVYAAGRLVAIARREEVWESEDWRRLETLARADGTDGDVRRVVLRLLDGRPADGVGRANRQVEGSSR
jgi:hypothetical protein